VEDQKTLEFSLVEDETPLDIVNRQQLMKVVWCDCPVSLCPLRTWSEGDVRRFSHLGNLYT
jgi:hypothetical protein